MSSFDKVVKLACKPKVAPPKAKYLEPIIAATWADDGSVHDVCKALSPRFREPNAVVVFKALIVLHTMIRNGSTDNVLGYLSSSEVLRLRNVSAGNWDGYAAPENIQNYAMYLDSRIRAYRELKHDAIRVQSETNRDIRNSMSVEEDSQRSRNGRSTKIFTPSESGLARSKTIMGRKLRIMTVEKGLLRETKTVQKMIDALTECQFYLDDLEDELTTTALRMLVKDLLILFQAGNEGVINLLEHYFEMSHVDAEESLAIYRHFCKQTERVVEYLSVARKLQNLLNVPIPNLKHAPVSLAGALQEYLDDPNFEQNRIEYKSAKESADRGDKKPASILKTSVKTETTVADNSALPRLSSSSKPTPPLSSKAAVDFFTAIEEEQPNIFHTQKNSPSNAPFQPQTVFNPFAIRMQMTGQPQIQIQPTGFIQPQQTGFQPSATNPFSLQLQSQPTGRPPFSAFSPQQTAFSSPTPATFLQVQPTSFLQPQATGAVNPFRQSMFLPQATGIPLFGGGAEMIGQPNTSTTSAPSTFPASTLNNPFPGLASNAFGSTNPFPNSSPGVSTTNPFPVTPLNAFGSTNPFPTALQGLSGSSIPNAAPLLPTGNNPSAPITAPSRPSFGQVSSPNSTSMPARPSSTPLATFGGSTHTSPPISQPIKTHQTGTKNPFGRITTPPPPVPRQLTLLELSMGLGNSTAQEALAQQVQLPPQEPQQTNFGGFGFNVSAGATDISSVASSFASNKKPDGAGQAPASLSTASSFSSSSGLTSNGLGALNAQNTAMPMATMTKSTFSDFSSLPIQPTGGPIQPQITGFAGLKPFKPTSSFGASLLESLPPIAGAPSMNPSFNGSAASTTNASSPGVISSPVGMGGNMSLLGGAGSSLGVGLRPQMTGGGAANPFRAAGNHSSEGVPPVPTLPNLNLGTSAFSPNLFSSGPSFGSTPQGGQQQQQNTSLLF